MTSYAFLLIMVMTLVAFVVGRMTATRFLYTRGDVTIHSLPEYHGAFVAAWVGIPAVLLVVLWLFLQGMMRKFAKGYPPII